MEAPFTEDEEVMDMASKVMFLQKMDGLALEMFERVRHSSSFSLFQFNSLLETLLRCGRGEDLCSLLQ